MPHDGTDNDGSGPVSQDEPRVLVDADPDGDVVPEPPADPLPGAELPPPAGGEPGPEPVIGDQELLELLDGLNQVNDLLDPESVQVVVLDSTQFATLGIGLAFVLFTCAFMLVVLLRR